ncbi:MAG: hypothetical protein ACKE51_04565 [Methylococcaceae bacterium]
MGNFTSKSNHFLFVLSLAAIAFLSSCSDDNKDVSTKNISKAVTQHVDNKSITPNELNDKNHYEEMSQPLDKANWLEKGKFRNEFARDCVARELNITNGKKLDRDYIEKTCDCIANYMDDHLTDQEAEEFLGEDNHMRALQIRYDAAAYHCVQKNGTVKEPTITKFN